MVLLGLVALSEPGVVAEAATAVENLGGDQLGYGCSDRCHARFVNTSMLIHPLFVQVLAVSAKS